MEESTLKSICMYCDSQRCFSIVMLKNDVDRKVKKCIEENKRHLISNMDKRD